MQAPQASARPVSRALAAPSSPRTSSTPAAITATPAACSALTSAPSAATLTTSTSTGATPRESG